MKSPDAALNHTSV